MAIRSIVTKEDSVLAKHSRPVTEFNERLHILLDDMKETLTASGGVGLAGPQVGVLRRVVIVIETNVPEEEEEYFIELVNPEIILEEGEQTGPEGCLSFPGEYGIVTRPNHAKVRAQDRNGNFFEVEGDALTARCFCHEIDHLNGILFPERAERMLKPEDFGEE
ncbi:MAG: peptide deformylase [Firmicutes bacterium HGW-Firmicutes-16]|nr:MAG: peptide deformylase [Firmicutes bacterium HGW-Firmicutes-16]